MGAGGSKNVEVEYGIVGGNRQEHTQIYNNGSKVKEDRPYSAISRQCKTEVNQIN